MPTDPFLVTSGRALADEPVIKGISAYLGVQCRHSVHHPIFYPPDNFRVPTAPVRVAILPVDKLLADVTSGANPQSTHPIRPNEVISRLLDCDGLDNRCWCWSLWRVGSQNNGGMRMCYSRVWGCLTPISTLRTTYSQIAKVDLDSRCWYGRLVRSEFVVASEGPVVLRSSTERLRNTGSLSIVAPTCYLGLFVNIASCDRYRCCRETTILHVLSSYPGGLWQYRHGLLRKLLGFSLAFP
jgi:hypothetical protein